jgi:hypothetical protein
VKGNTKENVTSIDTGSLGEKDKQFKMHTIKKYMLDARHN